MVKIKDGKLPQASRPVPPTRVWTQEQEAIFDAALGAKGNLGIRARAGTGKTSTIVEIAKRLPTVTGGSVFCAFGKEASLDLERKLPSSVKSKTIHSLLNSAVRKRQPGTKVNQYKTSDLCKQLCGRDWYGYSSRLGKLVSTAKNAGLKLEDTAAGVNYLFDVSQTLQLDDDKKSHDDLARMAFELLVASAERTADIDYDDMLWLPYINDWAPDRYGLVYVDEAQDLNKIQHWAVHQLSRNGGRVIIVGDDRQAIYQWRGALDDSLDVLFDEFETSIHPLTITQRCPKQVVQLVQPLVPDFRARDDAKDGVIRREPLNVSQLQPGDMVISRLNAPQVKLCIECLKLGKAARILGKNIGNVLLNLIGKSKAETIPELVKWIVDFQESETTKLFEIGREAEAEELVDKLSALMMMAQAASDVAFLVEQIKTLFIDKDEEGSSGRNMVTFTTAHRAKGLEADRVIVLNNFREGGAEDNLRYVAWTRSKQVLIFDTSIQGEV